jgi:hypothetical protein
MVATGVDVFRKRKFSSSRDVSRIHKKVHQKLPTGISLRGGVPIENFILLLQGDARVDTVCSILCN